MRQRRPVDRRTFLAGSAGAMGPAVFGGVQLGKLASEDLKTRKNACKLHTETPEIRKNRYKLYT